MEFFASAAKGTEGTLRDELREMRIRGVKADRGGVHFQGNAADGFRVCLWSRIAMRVLLKINEFDAETPADLYEQIQLTDWSEYLTSSHTVAISAHCKSSAMTHSQFISQKTKDAIVDQLRDKTGARPSVDLRDPDVRVNVHLVKNHAQVYLDMSGEPLHRRGYRKDMSEAPLKETLAAAILRFIQWDRALPLTDPMCGSGTFAIEAAMWAHNIPPAMTRARFGFERWAAHDDTHKASIATLRASAKEGIIASGPTIVATDIDEASVAATKANARSAGVSIEVSRQDVSEIRGTNPPGFVVTNPPYGERLAGGDELYARMADSFDQLPGHLIAILSGTPAIEDAISIKPREHTLFNGPIECRLLTYRVS